MFAGQEMQEDELVTQGSSTSASKSDCLDILFNKQLFQEMRGNYIFLGNFLCE
jgi:hypothetical protein